MQASINAASDMDMQMVTSDGLLMDTSQGLFAADREVQKY